MYLITLLRHGESEGNLAGLLQGQSDYPLTPDGVLQARKCASFWLSLQVKFDLIISSPLVRAAQTAEIIAKGLEIPIEFEPAWMERNFGRLQGEGIQEINAQVPAVDFFHPYEAIGGNGESQLDLFTRASLALQKILRQPEGSYLVVSHGGILNKALYVVMGITPQGHYNSPIFHFSNLGYAQLRYNPSTRQWAIMSLNNPGDRLNTEGFDTWNLD